MGYEVEYRETKDGDRYDVWGTVGSRYLKRGIKSPVEVAQFIVERYGEVEEWEVPLMVNTWILASEKAKVEYKIASLQAQLNFISQKQDEVRIQWREEDEKRRVKNDN